jgi:predicted nucleotide-binding protein
MCSKTRVRALEQCAGSLDRVVAGLVQLLPRHRTNADSDDIREVHGRLTSRLTSVCARVNALVQRGVLSQRDMPGTLAQRALAHLAQLDPSALGLGAALTDCDAPFVFAVAAVAELGVALRQEASFLGAHAPSTAISVRRARRVFIGHRHDEVNAYRLERMLRVDLMLHPVMLDFECVGSKTIIEKLEGIAKCMGYGFVICTPDDRVAGCRGVRQPRPNVLFELGWLYSHLGRARVSLLLKHGTTTCTDLGGIEYIPFTRSVDECFGKVVRQLRAAGLVRAVAG